MDPRPQGEVHRPSRPHRHPRLAALLGLAVLLTSCADEPAPSAPAADASLPAERGEVRFATTLTPPRVTTERVDPLGRPVSVACVTCHSLGGFSRPDRAVDDPPVAFHQGLVIDHGKNAGLTCGSCHAGPDYDTLHLANGREVPFAETMALCRQCHGPQALDFDHGAHGGMNGAWDKRFGDQVRQVCTTCHDPHSPAYAPMWPARPPGDARWTAPHAAPHAAPEPSPSAPDASKEQPR